MRKPQYTIVIAVSAEPRQLRNKFILSYQGCEYENRFQPFTPEWKDYILRKPAWFLEI